jgi:hypothetical protein
LLRLLRDVRLALDAMAAVNARLQISQVATLSSESRFGGCNALFKLRQARFEFAKPIRQLRNAAGRGQSACALGNAFSDEFSQDFREGATVGPADGGEDMWFSFPSHILCSPLQNASHCREFAGCH